MSYKGDQCGTGLCVTPAPTACSTVRHVHEVHTYEVVPRKTKKRLPWMQPWSANSVPYKAGSLVIHCNDYWYNLCETYSPPNENGDWHVFDPEEFFRWFHENARGGCNTLSIPVYARETGCTPRHEDPYCASTNYKLWMKGEVAAGADGKVYVSLVDNNAMFPPNTGWSQGRYLIDLIGELVVKGVAGLSSTANPNFTFVPYTSAQTVDVFLENWWTGLLGHSSDFAGKSFWRAQFMSATTPSQLVGVANGFVTASRDSADGGASDAALLVAMSDDRFIAALYNAFLGRDATSADVQYWANDARTLGRTQMIINFLANGEFATHALAVKGYTPTPTPSPTPTPTPSPTPTPNFTFVPYTIAQTVDVFLENWWTGLLGRVSEAAGKSFWRTELMSATTPSQLAGVANGFVVAARDPIDGGASDAAMLDSMSDSSFVAVMYKAFLGRDATSADLAYWANDAIVNGRTHMVLAFLNNSEFAAHALVVKGNG